jgi:hypothetical protein
MMLSAIARLLLILARSIGLVGALSSIVLWVTFLFFNPYSSPDQGFDLGPYVTAVMMIMLAVAAAWAVLEIDPLILLAAFVGSFPFGFYLMGTPSVLKWTGVCNLLYLVALVLIVGVRLVSVVSTRPENHHP